MRDAPFTNSRFTRSTQLHARTNLEHVFGKQLELAHQSMGTLLYCCQPRAEGKRVSTTPTLLQMVPPSLALPSLSVVGDAP
jgi:hypothetical protein